jgi:hypothetical protein
MTPAEVPCCCRELASLREEEEIEAAWKAAARNGTRAVVGFAVTEQG